MTHHLSGLQGKMDSRHQGGPRLISNKDIKISLYLKIDQNLSLLHKSSDNLSQDSTSGRMPRNRAASIDLPDPCKAHHQEVVSAGRSVSSAQRQLSGP